MFFVWSLCGVFTIAALFLIYDIIQIKINNKRLQQGHGGRINIRDTQRPVGGFHLNGAISDTSDLEEPMKEMTARKRKKKQNSKNKGLGADLRNNRASFIDKILEFIGWFPNDQYYVRDLQPRKKTSNSFGGFPNTQYHMMNTPQSRRQTSDSSAMLYNGENLRGNVSQMQARNPSGGFPNTQYHMMNTPQSRRQTSDSSGMLYNGENIRGNVSQMQTRNPSGGFPNTQYHMTNTPQSRRQTSDSSGNFGNFENPMTNPSLRRELPTSSGNIEHVHNPTGSSFVRKKAPAPFGNCEHVKNPMRSPSPRMPTPVPFENRGNFENPMENPSLEGQISVSPGILGCVENPMRSFSPNRNPSDSIDLSQMPNVAFYENRIPAAPNKEYIDEILNSWIGNYATLEKNTTFLQWLFPNRAVGTNSEAHVLNDAEAKIIRENPTLKNKVKRAFIMMLDFYGMELTGPNQIQLKENYKKRLKQLNKKDSPKFLSITRILLALKELGHHDLMLPWLKCFGNLIYTENKLCHAKYSFKNFWINTLDAEDKIALDLTLKSI